LHAFRPRIDAHFVIAFAAVALAYAATLWLMPLNGVWIVDEGCRVIQAEGFIRNGYRDVSIPWPGQAFDPDLSLNPIPPPMGIVRDGKIVGVYSHAFTAASAPLRSLLGPIGLYVLPFLAGLLLLPAVWLLAEGLGAPRSARSLSVLLVGLGTPVWFYSMTVWEHVPAVCLTTWAVVFLWRHLRYGGLRSLAASALCSGLAVYLRDELYLMAIVLAGALLVMRGARGARRVVSFGAFFVATVVPLWLYQWRVTGSPLGAHVAANMSFWGGTLADPLERWPVFRTFLVNGHRSLIVSLLVAAPFLASWAACARIPRSGSRWCVPALSLLAAAGALVVLQGYRAAESPIWWMYDANALWAACPFLILAFAPAGPGSSGRGGAPPGGVAGVPCTMERLIWTVATGFVLLMVLVTPLSTAVGVHWGARLLLPVYPLLAVLAAGVVARSFEPSHGRVSALTRAAIVLLLAVSLVTQVYGLSLLRERKAFTARLSEAVLAREERVVVVDRVGFLPELAPCFYRKILALPRDAAGMMEVPALTGAVGEARALFVLSKDVPGPGRETQQVVADPLNFAPRYLRSIDM
jgi:hypothetical protein